MSKRYKLVRADVETCSYVKPIDEQGKICGDTVITFENNEDYYFAIYYEKTTPEGYKFWDEYDSFGQDFERAVKTYKELVKGENYVAYNYNSHDSDRTSQ